MAGKKGMRRTIKRYSPSNPKSVNYYEKVRKRQSKATGCLLPCLAFVATVALLVLIAFVLPA